MCIRDRTQDAEKYEEEDQKFKKCVEAKNSLEGYCFQIRSTLSDSKLKDKIDEETVKPILDQATDVLQWLETNQLAEVEEFESKRKELEEVFNPVMEKIYSSAMPSGMEDMAMPSPSASNQATHVDPKIEEVD